MAKKKEINIDINNQEITNNIPGFPVACYHSEFTSGTYDYIDWHWHLEFQICLTLRGTVIWGSESQQTPVHTGEGIFINSRRAHMARPQGNQEAEFFCVDILPSFLCADRESNVFKQSVQPVLDEARLQVKGIDNNTLQGAEIIRILSDLSDVFSEKESGYEFDLISGVFSLWKNLRDFLEEDIDGDTIMPDDRFREMLMFLQTHYNEEIGLDEIASHVGLSRSECCRYFKRQSGQTIFDYLTRYRVHKSIDMLRGSDRDIAQIAQDCGFSNQSYYTRRFREIIGFTPLKYRRKCKR